MATRAMVSYMLWCFLKTQTPISTFILFAFTTLNVFSILLIKITVKEKEDAPIGTGRGRVTP